MLEPTRNLLTRYVRIQNGFDIIITTINTIAVAIISTQPFFSIPHLSLAVVDFVVVGPFL